MKGFDREVNQDVVGFTARQFAREFEAGAQPADAAARVRAALPQDLHWAVVEIERAFAGASGPRELPQLGPVIDTARKFGGSPQMAFAAYERAAAQMRPSLVDALAGATTFGAYLIGLVVMLGIVVGIYAMYVLPSMATMFSLVGAPLPAFTNAVIGSPWLLLPVPLLLAALLSYVTNLRRFRRRLLALQPVRPMLRWVPGLAEWAASYDTFLWLRYQVIFLDAGLETSAAADAATLLAGEPRERDHRRALFGAAAKLGRLREELAAQLEVDREATLEQFERHRNGIVIFLRVLIYFIVSSYVIAMYLPIFKLGAVV